MNRDVTLLRRFEDPEHSADPQIRALVADLRSLDYAPAPRAEFRTELRAQLVAIASRVVAEGEPTTARAEPAESPATVTSLVTTSKAALRTDAKRRSFGRPLGLAAACVAVLALGLGGAVWKSQSALPGSSLYGLKRASEDVRLSLTSGDTARGHEYLRLASTRVQEARDLIGQPSSMASGSGVVAAGISPQTEQLIRSTLESANSDLTSGSSLLGTEAVQSHSAAPLQIMTSWAPGQRAKLSQLASAVRGTGALHTSAEQSLTLVSHALVRARTIAPKVKDCTASGTDELGPTCASSPAHVDKTPRSKPRTHAAHHRSGKNHTPGKGAGTSPGTAPSTGPAKGGSSTGGKHHHPTASPSPTPTEPGLPSILPSGLIPTTLPVSIGSCGISVQAGPIGLQLGSCPPSS